MLHIIKGLNEIIKCLFFKAKSHKGNTHIHTQKQIQNVVNQMLFLAKDLRLPNACYYWKANKQTTNATQNNKAFRENNYSCKYTKEIKSALSCWTA